MMHIIFEIFIILTMMFPSILISDEIVCTLPSGKKTSILIVESNKQSYVKVSELSAKILAGSVFNPAKNTIAIQKGLLNISPQSSQLQFEVANGTIVKARMRFPTIKQNGELFVPFDEFTTALNSFGLRSIIRMGKNTYRIGNGIDPTIAATFSIPETAIIDQKEDETSKIKKKNTLSSEDSEDLIVSSQLQNPVRKEKTQSQTDRKLQVLAESAQVSNTEKCSIIGISAEVDKQDIVFTFTSNIPIEKYQKPEIRGRELIIRFPDTEDGLSSLKQLTTLSQIKSFEKQKIRNYLLYVIRFSEDISLANIKKLNSKTISVTVQLEKESVFQSSTSSSPSTKGAWDLDVIVLDPGHGGEDAGALSINGYKEKDITLAISLKVRDLLRKEMPSTKVVMTRDDDTFIELYRRGQIANKQKGKLFISIHCNSMPTKPHPANGCESYILRPGRNSEAVRVAEKENGSIRLEKEQINYDDMSEEKLIIATMAQSAFVKFSEKFAAMLQRETAGKTGLFNRGVNQAGFLVLVGASMPNVLFETGFLSNINDEKTLITEKGQQSMAEGIVKAIKRYAAEYAKNN